MTETDLETPKPPKKGRRHIGRFMHLLFGASVLLLAMLAIGLIIVVDREVSLPERLQERIRADIDTAVGEKTIAFDDVTLTLGKDLHPTVRIYNAAYLQNGTPTGINIPELEATFSPRGVVYERSLLLQTLEVRDANVRLMRTESGALSISLPETDNAPLDLNEARQNIENLLNHPALAALEVITVDGVNLSYEDRRAGRSYQSENVRIGLDITPDWLVLDARVILKGAQDSPVQIFSSLDVARNSKALSFALNISDAQARDIALQMPEFAWLGGMDAGIDASIRGEINSDGVLQPINTAVSLAHGIIQPRPEATPLPFESLKTYISYEPSEERVRFNSVAFESAFLSFYAQGDAFLETNGNGLPLGLNGQFAFENVSGNPGYAYETPPQAEAIEADLRMAFDPFVLELPKISASLEHARLESFGFVRTDETGWRYGFDANAPILGVETLKSYWPAGIGGNTRKWIEENIYEADFRNVSFSLRGHSNSQIDWSANYEFENARLRVMKSMPPIETASGYARVFDHQFDVTLDQGFTTPEEGGRIDMSGSRFRILDMREKPATGVTDLRASGSITAALSLINRPPFSLMDKANLPVALSRGTATTTGEIRGPVIPKPPAELVRYDFRSELRDVDTRVLVPNHQLTANALSVRSRNGSLTISGDMRYDGVPANGTFSRETGPGASREARVDARVQLSPENLSKLGIALPQGMVTGSGQGDLQLTFSPGAPTRYRLISALQGVGVAINAVNWRKPQNARADFLVEGRLGNTARIDRLRFEGAGLTAQGEISLKPNGGGLDVAEFSNVQIGNRVNGALTMRGRGAGVPAALAFRGSRLDLRGQSMSSSSGSSTGRGGPLTVAVDRLQLTDSIALSNFRGDFTTQGGFSGQFTGRLNNLAPIQGAIRPPREGGTIDLASSDAGRVFAALNILKTAHSGTMRMRLTPIPGGQGYDGALNAEDVRVRDAPVLASLLDAVSVVGLIQQLDGEGLYFDNVDSQFRITPQQVVIKQFSAIGAGLGVSLDGYYLPGSKQIDIQGVISPFYLVNGIGALLTRPGEGLVGFNFNLKGSASQPQLSVNPLSVLTPAMFREIFRRPPPT